MPRKAPSIAQRASLTGFKPRPTDRARTPKPRNRVTGTVEAVHLLMILHAEQHPLGPLLTAGEINARLPPALRRTAGDIRHHVRKIQERTAHRR